MADKILVAYASKYGATREIAEKIAETLNREGLTAEVSPADKVKDLPNFRAVVLGSAAYIGGWRKEAVSFLTANTDALAQLPTWVFSSGPTGEGDPVELVQGWRFPNKVHDAIEIIKPRDTAVLHGCLDVNKLNFIEKFMIGKVKAATGDFRDWKAIDVWALGIANSLK